MTLKEEFQTRNFSMSALRGKDYSLDKILTRL
jgi:hypothetical protein